MAGLNIITTQDSISEQVKTLFPNYVVYDDVVLDDEFIIKQGNKVKPYIVLQYGGLKPSATNGSFAGTRHDEYYSTVDLCVVGPTPNQAKRGLVALIDSMVGWKPVDSTPLAVSSSMDIIGIPDNVGSIVVYLASVRLSYNINTTGIGEYITH